MSSNSTGFLPKPVGPQRRDEFPDLLKVNLDQFIDHRVLQALDRSGFIDALYKK